MKKNELIELLSKYGHNVQVLSNMKLGELKSLLDEENKAKDCDIILEYPSQENNESSKIIKSVESENKTTAIPLKTDAEWPQYVMGQFADDEMEGTNPRLDGLRRVAEKLLGEIIEEGCELISTPTIENQFRASVKAWVIFRNHFEHIRFEALADAYEGNLTQDFSIYLVAMADTRAKARAYRAALRLRKIVAAEEIGVNNAGSENNNGGNSKIAIGQITLIRMMADRQNISITKLLKDLEINGLDEKDNLDLTKLSHTEGLLVVKRLNELRSSGVVQSKLIKDN